MKTLFIAISTVVIALFASVQSHAALQNVGTDSLGNNLIYDSDLDITWYDFTSKAATWQDQLNWADRLVVEMNGTLLSDWRLPTVIDGAEVHGYDGTTTAGYNITSSEMGHLLYTEVGNKGYYATDGTAPQEG